GPASGRATGASGRRIKSPVSSCAASSDSTSRRNSSAPAQASSRKAERRSGAHSHAALKSSFTCRQRSAVINSFQFSVFSFWVLKLSFGFECVVERVKHFSDFRVSEFRKIETKNWIPTAKAEY